MITRNPIIPLDGPPNKVLIAAATNVGIGDAIHAMPAVWQMIADDYDVTVNCMSFTAPLWHSIGAKTTHDTQGLGWEPQGFGALYQPHLWNHDARYNTMDRFDAFAEEIGVCVPDSFSWIDVLKPNAVEGEPYILFAPEATSLRRAIPRQRAIYNRLAKTGKVIWLTQGSRFPSVQEYRRVESISPGFMQYKLGIASEKELLAKIQAEDTEGKTQCQDIRQLLDLVFNASRVVASESGVAAIAAAFAKPLTVYYGATGHEHTIGQFKRFHAFEYEAIEDAADASVFANALTGEDKIFQMREIIDPNVNGDVAEVGVYKGGTARLLAKEFKDRDCFFFDTFEGMPVSGDSDVHAVGDFADVSLAQVERLLSDCPNAHCIAGTFPNTADAIRDKTFAYVYLDADQYESTKDGLEFFWPRLNPGGVIALDDYKWPNCPGVERALEEFGQPVHSPVPFFAYIKKSLT